MLAHFGSPLPVLTPAQRCTGN